MFRGKKETRCLYKKYNFQFYFILYKVEERRPKGSNAKHVKFKKGNKGD